MVVHANVLSDIKTYRPLLALNSSLLQDLDAAHSLVFYPEGNVSTANQSGRLRLSALLRHITQAVTPEAMTACELTIKNYLDRTMLFVEQLLAAKSTGGVKDGQAAHSTVDAKLLLALTGSSVDSDEPVKQTAEESLEVEELQDMRPVHTLKQARTRLRAARGLIKAIRCEPVVGGHLAGARCEKRNVSLAHVDRYLEWLEVCLQDMKPQFKLEAVDAAHRGLKEAVVAGLYRYPAYRGSQHRVSLPTSEAKPRPLGRDNNVCATFKELMAYHKQAGHQQLVDSLPKSLEATLGWLSGIHDHLVYPRKRGEEGGVYLLVHNIMRAKRKRQEAKDSGIEAGWSVQSKGEGLDPEKIEGELEKAAGELVETGGLPCHRYPLQAA